MRRTLWMWSGFLFTFIIWAASPRTLHAEEPGKEEPAKHVIMISIDGLCPEIYLNPQKEKVQVPNLMTFKQQGVYAKRMIPVFPSVTYPGHTTLVTGVNPADHGVVSNFKKGTEWYLQAADIKAKTLWQVAQEKGLTTAIVTWPASYGAKVDYLIPENLSFKVPDTRALIRQGSTPGLFERLERKLGPVHLSSFEQEGAGEQLDEMTAKFAAEIIKQYKPHLLLMHFLDTDHRQHADGPTSPKVIRAFDQIDHHIGDIRQAAQDAGILETTTFVIVGDHGFLPVHTAINVNALLASVGYGKLTKEKTFVPSGVVATPIGGAVAFYPERPGNAQSDVKATATLRKEIRARYAGLVNVVARPELDELGAFPGALFALTAHEGYMFTAAPTLAPLVSTGGYRGMHGYHPSVPAMATGFIISGPDIRKGVALPIVRMIDVAPTVASLLGLELKEANGFPMIGIEEKRKKQQKPSPEKATSSP